MNNQNKIKVEEPRVSVCIPVYNSEGTIEKTLNSILNQTYKNFEVIIVDNASTDNTFDILKRFKDSRIKLYRNDRNTGAEHNWNRCIELTNGEYTAIFHADDIYDKYILEKEVKTFKDNPSILAVFTLADHINDRDEIIGKFDLPPGLKGKKIYYFSDILIQLMNSGLKNANPFLTPTAIVKTEIYKKLAPFKWDDFKTAADLDMWLRILRNGQVAILDERLIKYRLSSNKGVYKIDYSRTYEEDFFKVIDYHLSTKPDDLYIPKSAFERYEIRRSIDKLKRAVNYLRNGDCESAKDLLKKFPSLSVFLPILKNIRQPELLFYWFMGVIILFMIYIGVGKSISRVLQWYRYNWKRRWLK